MTHIALARCFGVENRHGFGRVDVGFFVANSVGDGFFFGQKALGNLDFAGNARRFGDVRHFLVQQDFDGLLLKRADLTLADGLRACSDLRVCVERHADVVARHDDLFAANRDGHVDGFFHDALGDGHFAHLSHDFAHVDLFAQKHDFKAVAGFECFKFFAAQAARVGGGVELGKGQLLFGHRIRRLLSGLDVGIVGHDVLLVFGSGVRPAFT